MHCIMFKDMSLSTDRNNCVTPEHNLRCNSPDFSPDALKTCVSSTFQKTKFDGNKNKRKTLKMTRKQKRSMRVSLHSVHERQRHSTVNQAIQYLKTTLPSKEPTNQDTKFMVLNRAVEYVDFLQRKVLDLGRQTGKAVYFKEGYLCTEVPSEGLGSKVCGTGKQMHLITPGILEELLKKSVEERDDVANELESRGTSAKDIENIKYPCTPKREFGVVPSNTPDTSLQSPCGNDRFLSLSRGDQLLPISSSGMSLSPIIGSSQSTSTRDSDPFLSPEFSPCTSNNFPYEHSYSRKVLSHDEDIMELEDSISVQITEYSSSNTSQTTDELKEFDEGLLEENHIKQGNSIQHQRKTTKKLQMTNCDPFESYDRLSNCKSSSCEMCISPASKCNISLTEENVNPSPPPPKSWINGYQLYTRLNYQLYKMEHPDLVGREVTKALGNAWRELPEEDRKRYSQQACELNEQRRVEREAIIMTQQKSRDMKTS